MNGKFEEFYRISKLLNSHKIRVLLFGSLGLQQRLNEDLYADDIDILVPEIFINEKWETLKKYIEELGYFLEDLHEHQFRGDGFKVAFASIESLESFAGVNIDSIPVEKNGQTEYMLLTLEQYLKVYTRSSEDSYRRNKNNGKDLIKIELIKRKLNLSKH